MGLILLIAAIAISLFLYPFGLLCTCWVALSVYPFKPWSPRQFWLRLGWAVKYLNVHFLRLATAFDATGGVVCKDLFNLILITKDGYKFGNRKETISSVLGKNRLKGTLTKAGRALDWLLNKAERDHSIKSIDERV